MKKKYLKKILAVMLATMTVSATPGLVGAMSGEARKAIQEANSKIASKTLTEADETSMLDKFEEMANEDDEAKAEVAKTIKNGFLNYLFRRESRDKIINILSTCSQSKDGQTKSDIATAIDEILFCSNWELNPNEGALFARVLNILETCAQDPAAMSEVAHAISRMGYGHFYEFNDDSRFKILNILEKCAIGSADARSSVASAIRTMFYIKDQSLNKFMNKSLDRVIDILEVCAQEPKAIEDVARVFRYMNRSHTDGHNLTDIVHKMLGILNTCAENDDATKSKTAIAIFWFSRMIDKESVDDILINTLDKFSKNIESAEEVSKAIGRLSERGVLNQCDQEKTRQIIDIFLSSSRRYTHLSLSNDNAQSLIEHGVFDRCRPNQVQKLFDELIKNLKEHGDGIAYFDKQMATEAIKEMVKKNLLTDSNIETIISFAYEVASWGEARNACSIINTIVENDNIMKRSPDLIPKTVDALTKILQGDLDSEYNAISILTTMCNKDMLRLCDDVKIKGIADSLIKFLRPDHTGNHAVDAILAMNEKGLLNRCTPDQIQKIVGNLTGLLGNNDTREKAVNMIANIVRNNNMLSQLTPAELGQLANVLPGILANDNTKEAATIIISAMAKNPATFNQFNNAQRQQILHLFKTQLDNYLDNGNYEMADKIFAVLKKCSEIDALKADVANFAEMLTYEDNFYQYLNQDSETPILGNFLDILTSCSKTQNAEAREKAVCAVSMVIRNINILINTNIEIPDKIPQIIEMLEESSNVGEVKVHVADAIKLLGEKNLLNNQDQIHGHHLVNAIDNCLEYENNRISDMENVDADQQNTAASVNAIFRDYDWVASFIKHLSPDDTARFFELADEARNAFENAYKHM